MEHPPELQDDMAALVVHNPQQPQSGPKRYRPAPAKTFQCRGYGECRMVFSRSEHLARHIRKHTGERPFTCHCGKQFSRLDNLRQHAQTVHADKQDQNERMMRDLTSLHASMAAANKLSSRGGRRPPPTHSIGASNGNASHGLVKQEDLPMPLHQRPGTSTGYEGDHNSFLYQQQSSWHVQGSDSSKSNNHSFRDSTQSFLGPPATSPSSAATSAPGQSFLPFTSSLGFSIPDSARDGRPRTSSSRPPTSGGLTDAHSRSLPPLSAVVSASFAPPPNQQHIQSFPAPPGSSHGQSGSVLLPGSLTLRRPTTATRPGTAPASASLFSAKSTFGGSGMGFSRPELSIQSYGRSANSHLGSSHSTYDPEPSSPTGNDASPFFFSPPSTDPSPAANSTIRGSPPASINSRKRPFAGSDGPYDDATHSSSSRDSAYDYDYEYGSESRPQSRRLSVMELCNDHGNAGSHSFLLSSARAESRPTTSSALVSSASALALVDRSPPIHSSPTVQSRPAQYPTSASAASSHGSGGTQEDFGGDRISPPLRRAIPSPSSILPFRSGTAGGGGSASFVHSPSVSSASTASYSPRSASGTASPFSSRSPIPGSDATSSTIPRRTHGDDNQHDQIRFARASHTSPALGLRV